MPTPDRPHKTELSHWKGRAKVLEIRERWRVFCDAQVRRLNSPAPVRSASGETAGDELPADSLKAGSSGSILPAVRGREGEGL